MGESDSIMVRPRRPVQVSGIVVRDGRRPLDPKHVARLAESMSGPQGLIQAIGISKDHELIFGAHRLAAAKQLGWTTIDAELWSGDAMAMRLAAIDENISKGISVAERAKMLAEGKALHIAKHPETAKGKAGGKASGVARTGHRANGTTAKSAVVQDANCPTVSFVAATAAKTDRSERSIEQEVAIGERLTNEALGEVTGTPVANNAAALARIVEESDPVAQVERAKEEVKKAAEPRKPRLRLVDNGRKKRPQELEFEELVEQVAPLLAEGMTVNEIAKKLGRPKERVQYAKDRLGLTKRANHDPIKRIADAASEYGDSLRDLMNCAESVLGDITTQQARTAVSALDGLINVVRGIQNRLNKEAKKAKP